MVSKGGKWGLVRDSQVIIYNYSKTSTLASNDVIQPIVQNIFHFSTLRWCGVVLMLTPTAHGNNRREAEEEDE